ncbi:hypothetical protein FHW69_001294 [Luteibacter sp. Sphag1AF]|uniref:hypothetical protein n=1 Tax=Luteibacter sp. Sphag1AF TaxID=2587031 RepID=UPI001618B816|nr:hypothetical protein [Luteibacter sp. Sphag1AF]MBB3226704.1 hypothetical protein [Luteibacter sp. Sphag1AF]
MNPTRQTLSCPSCHSDVELSNDQLHSAVVGRLNDATDVLDVLSHTFEADMNPAVWRRTARMAKRLIEESKPAIDAIRYSRVEFIPSDVIMGLCGEARGDDHCTPTSGKRA